LRIKRVAETTLVIRRYLTFSRYEQAKIQSFERWKISEGWYGHQAAIIPVTKQVFELALSAFVAGAIDTMNEEKECCINY
jgi:hypothetical protein